MTSDDAPSYPGPTNTVAVDDVPVALIDWDFAHPAPRAWDVAHAMSHFARLPSQDPAPAPEERGRRMGTFCRGYGLLDPADRRGLVDIYPFQIGCLIAELERIVAEGDALALHMWRDSQGAKAGREDMAYLHQHKTVLEEALLAA